MTTQITNHNVISDLNGIYSFLSDKYESTIVYEGIEYPSVYNAYIIQFFNNIEDRKELANKTIDEIENYIDNETYELRPNTELYSLPRIIAKELNAIKFSDPSLAKKLIETSDTIIESKNQYYDLGKILMEIREQLKEGFNHA